VDFVKPDGFHRPRLSVGEDHSLADKLRVGLIEGVEDRQRTMLHSGHASLTCGCAVAVQ
jgi:hypothetical protein